MLSGYVPEGSAVLSAALVPVSLPEADEFVGASVGASVGAAVGAGVGVGLAFHFATTVKSFCGIVAGNTGSQPSKV